MAQNGITFVRMPRRLCELALTISSWWLARTRCQDTRQVSFRNASRSSSDSQHAVDFFQAICNMTSGLMLPLTTADLLAMTIVGSVLENMDMERLISGESGQSSPIDIPESTEIGSEVAQRIQSKGESLQSVEEVAQ